MTRTRLGLLVVVLLGLSVILRAATYTVDDSGGKDYTTIQACVNAAVAGDVCDVYTGTYNETVSSARSGTNNATRITIQRHTGETPTVTAFSITHDWITIDGFTVNTGASSAVGIGLSNATDGVIVKNNTVQADRNTCIQSGTNTGPTHTLIQNNTVSRCGFVLPATPGSAAPCIESYGTDALVEGNDLTSCSDDPIKAGGDRVVVRNNTAHDLDVDQSGDRSQAHLDFVHNGANGLRKALIEGNTWKNCVDPTGNCHAFILQGTHGSGDAIDNVIARYNWFHNLDNTTGAYVGGGSYSPYYVTIYNNTSTDTAGNSDSGIDTGASAISPRVKNNIFYNVASNSSYFAYHQPIYDEGSTDFQSNGNLPFHSGYSGAWTQAIGSEATYNTLKNQDPLFANYPTNVTLQSGSPARNAGVALTTVAVADTGTGTSLVLTDASYFQPGWGPSYALVNGDVIRIGASTTATITAVDYTTNTVTLSGSVSRNDGDNVYLYQKSDGVQVLSSSNPDLGASPFASSASAPGRPRFRFLRRRGALEGFGWILAGLVVIRRWRAHASV